MTGRAGNGPGDPSPGCRRAVASAEADATGFTLIELMIVLAVIAVIAAIAVPSFLDSIQRSRRSDAQIALVEITALQDKFRNDNMTYATVLSALPYPAVSPEQYYQLSLVGTVSATFFQARATPQGAQAGDTDCAAFNITSTHVKSVTDSGNNDNTDSCWP